MGNRRSVEKALERVGARAVLTADPDALRAADGLVLPGVGAFPRAMELLRDARARRAARTSARPPACRSSASASACSCCSSARPSTAAPTGLGLLPGDGPRRSTRRGLKLPHIGWSDGALDRVLAAARRACPTRRAFYLVHSFVPHPADEADVLGTGEYGERFASVVARGNVFGAQFHPEKSSRARAARCSRNFAALCAHGTPRMILYPAIDILDGQAVRLRPGRLRRRDRLRRPTRSTRRARWVEAGAQLPARRRPRRRQARRAREPRARRARSRRELAVPVQVGGGLRVAGVGARGARRRRRARDPRHRRAARRRPPRRLPRRVHGERVDRRGRRARRARSSVSGWTESTGLPAEAVIESLQHRGVRSFVYTNVDRDGMLGRASTLDEVERIADGRARARSSTPAASARSTTCARSPRCGRSNLGGVIVGKALYEGRFTVAEGQAALKGR